MRSDAYEVVTCLPSLFIQNHDHNNPLNLNLNNKAEDIVDFFKTCFIPIISSIYVCFFSINQFPYIHDKKYLFSNFSWEGNPVCTNCQRLHLIYQQISELILEPCKKKNIFISNSNICFFSKESCLEDKNAKS